VSLPVILQPAARDEYDEAFDWFEARKPGEGIKFADAIQKALDRIAANPRMHARVHQDVRKAWSAAIATTSSTTANRLTTSKCFPSSTQAEIPGSGNPVCE
jgi:plasmid stabilization system protein ParE